jgi:hypothetical protein
MINISQKSKETKLFSSVSQNPELAKPKLRTSGFTKHIRLKAKNSELPDCKPRTSRFARQN